MNRGEAEEWKVTKEKAFSLLFFTIRLKASPATRTFILDNLKGMKERLRDPIEDSHSWD